MTYQPKNMHESMYLSDGHAMSVHFADGAQRLLVDNSHLCVHTTLQGSFEEPLEHVTKTWMLTESSLTNVCINAYIRTFAKCGCIFGSSVSQMMRFSFRIQVLLDAHGRKPSQ